MPAPVAIAVISWNTAALLDRCLVSLRVEHEAGRAEVWVVDNASTDGSAALVAERHPWARLEAASENLGFGAAVNRVAAATATPFLAAANADVALSSGALQALLDAAEAHPRAGAFAPRLITADGATQHSVHPFPTVRTGLLLSSGLAMVGRVARALPLESHWDPGVARDVDWAHGAFLLVRRTAWDAVGGFDPAQWLYAEDLDLAWRLRSIGWRTWYEPAAVVRHSGSVSTRKAFGPELEARFMTASYAWMARRRGLPVERAVAALNFAGSALRALALRPLARIRPARYAEAARGYARWSRIHAEGLGSRARVTRGH